MPLTATYNENGIKPYEFTELYKTSEKDEKSEERKNHLVLSNNEEKSDSQLQDCSLAIGFSHITDEITSGRDAFGQADCREQPVIEVINAQI